MKSIFLTAWNSRSYGGVSEVVRQLGRALVERSDMDFSVVSFDDRFSESDRHWYSGIPMYYYSIVNLPIVKSLGLSFDLYPNLCKIKPDIIETQGVWMYFSAAALHYKKKHGAKIVVTPHGMLDTWAVQNSGWKKKIVGYLFEYDNLKNADCLKALCQSEYESLRSFGLKNPIAIIPNGIDLPSDDIVIKRNTTQKILLFVGRIHPKKGIRELILAINILNQRHPQFFAQWRVRIAGWDQNGHTQELINLTNKLGLSEVINFIGPVFESQKQKELCEANAFVLTSFSEGLPMSVLEAWAYKLPVLMTDFCNLPEGFLAKAAIRVEPTANSICQGLIELFSMDESELEQMGKNGLDLVKQKFTWKQVANQTCLLYKWLLGASPKPEFVVID